MKENGLDTETPSSKPESLPSDDNKFAELSDKENIEQSDSSEEIPFIITNLEENEKDVDSYEDQIITKPDTEIPDQEAIISTEETNSSHEEEIKENIVQTITDQTTMEQEIDTNSQPKKNHSKILITCVAVFLLIVALSAVGWSFYSEAKAAERQEALDLAVLCKENYNLEDYEYFLNKYPQSVHCREVRLRLNELKKLAEDWKAIETSQNENTFVDFKNKYNDPYYSRLCNLKLDSIDWISAKAANTPDAYQRYLSRHPHGIYLSDAIIAKSEVAYMNISEQEQTDIRSICNQFFSALGVNNSEQIQIFLAPQVSQFMNLENPDLQQILDWASKNQQDYSFVNYFIHDDFKISKEISEYNEEYFQMLFTIDQITTNDNGEETPQAFTATMTMNKNHQLTSLIFKQL